MRQLQCLYDRSPIPATELTSAWLTRAVGAAALLLGGASAPAWAARCDQAKDPISLSETQPMDYGTIALTSGGGTVTLAANGAISATGGLVLSGVPLSGKFKVTGGKSGCSVSISFVAGSLVGPGTMAINNFTTNAGANPTLDGTGVLNFAVGADLAVNAGQLGGSYSGTYSVTVVY
jgi:hypothetical protein